MFGFLQAKAAYCCSGKCTGWTNQEDLNNSVVFVIAGSSVHLTYGNVLRGSRNPVLT